MKELDDFTVEQLQEIETRARVSVVLTNGKEVAALARIALAAKKAQPLRVEIQMGDVGLMERLKAFTCPRTPGEMFTPVFESNSPELPDGWIPCAERMPAPGVVVLVYSPPQPGDYPGDVRIGFDFIDPDGDDPAFWYEHGQNYEHFSCVAGGLEGCTGPSEKAPYTHWQPIPTPPTTEK